MSLSRVQSGGRLPGFHKENAVVVYPDLNLDLNRHRVAVIPVSDRIQDRFAQSLAWSERRLPAIMEQQHRRPAKVLTLAQMQHFNQIAG